ARSVRLVREHGKMARTPLAAFFNRPIMEPGANRWLVTCVPGACISPERIYHHFQFQEMNRSTAKGRY
ncbi:MAG: hypothetical protein KC588_14525, partial [Nitrospira sp.]|nr:hypothetical protein [Nitrospira sp.]